MGSGLRFRRRAFAAACGCGLALAAWNAAASQAALRPADVRSMARLSGLPEKSVVSIRQGLAVAIRDPGTRRPDGVVEGVVLHGEALGPEAAETLGFVSMRSRVDVDCETRRDRVVEMHAFDRPGLAGTPRERPVPGGWIQPSPQAYLADVLRTVCGLRRSSDLQLASLDPDAPIATAETAKPRLRPTVGLEPPAAPPPASTPTQPPPPPAKPAVAARPGRVGVQVAAAGTRAGAEQALLKVRRLTPAGVSGVVEEARVDGRTFHRAILRGFQTREAAAVFCRKVTAAGGECFVR
ncbi:MAG: SPOR domain-containing protein [Phenylobacterium sp.]|uniref:SPOR domain-containing protein n=1 Tax=Phenylobacterium sp. TaxID=1871053 RepID=UPI00391C32A2